MPPGVGINSNVTIQLELPTMYPTEEALPHKQQDDGIPLVTLSRLSIYSLGGAKVAPKKSVEALMYTVYIAAKRSRGMQDCIAHDKCHGMMQDTGFAR